MSQNDNIKAGYHKETSIQLVEYVRISLGTAMKLGLESGPFLENFTTAFLMTYHDGGCTANCSFCPQASSSESNPELLSRIGWPQFKLDEIAEKLAQNKDFKRVCIQSLNYPGVVEDVIQLVLAAKRAVGARVSVCIHPVSTLDMIRLRDAGVDNMGIAIDACTPSLFDKVKGNERNSRYTWEGHIAAIKEAQTIFGKDNVTTHLIVGMGESEDEIVKFLFDMQDLAVRVGLFAFTPVEGTNFEKIPQPDLGRYRRVQILRNLMTRGKVSKEEVFIDALGKIAFAKDEKELRTLLSSGVAFQVSGCPGCNRPYYNERPRGPMYNYPRQLSEEECEQALSESGLVK
ncbi:MAG: radical SAM protein [Candidatus Thorarchaeota archaeon]